MKLLAGKEDMDVNYMDHYNEGNILSSILWNEWKKQ